MTARVLAVLLFTDQESITAGARARGSVSTAIKSLSGVGLLMSTQNTVVRMMLRAAERGLEMAGENNVAGRRLATMRDFYSYHAHDHTTRYRAAVDSPDAGPTLTELVGSLERAGFEITIDLPARWLTVA